MIHRRRAVMDLGTNSCRLLIGEQQNNGKWIELYRDVIITRLGEGVDKSGYLKTSRIIDTILALQNFLAYCRQYQASLKRIVATNAVREAHNKNELFQKLAELDISCEVISGEEEAELTYIGATQDETKDAVVFDLGGGSLELISKNPILCKSTPVGAVKIAEKYSDGEGRMNIEQHTEAVVKQLMEYLTADDLKAISDHVTMIGVGGTATTFARISQGMDQYDKQYIQNLYLDYIKLINTLTDLNHTTIEERMKKFNLPSKRADIIVAGGVIILALIKLGKYSGFIIRDNDLLQGMLYHIE